MMKCARCGLEVGEFDRKCLACGSTMLVKKDMPQLSPEVQRPVPYQYQQTSTLAIIGFVLSFFIPIVSIILCVMGRSEIRRSNGALGGDGLALAGIIISCLWICIGFLALLAAATAVPDVGHF